MAITTHTLTGSLGDLVGDDLVDDWSYRQPVQVRAWVETNIPGGEAVVDTGVDGTVHLGPHMLALDDNFTFTETDLIATDASSLNWDGLLYRVVVEYPNQVTRSRDTFTSPWFEHTADQDIRATIERSYAPPTATSELLTEMEALLSSTTTEADRAETEADRAEDAADAAAALVLSDLGTTDGQTRALIENPASQTAGALAVLTAAQARGIRRQGITDLAVLGQGPYFIKRRSADQHRIWRQMADGHYVEWVLGRTITERHLIGHQRPEVIQAGQTGGVPVIMVGAEQGTYTGTWTHNAYQTVQNPPTPVPTGWVTSIVPSNTPPADHQGYERISVKVGAVNGSLNLDITPTATVTNKALTSNVATLTIGAHPFVVGDTVAVAGVDGTFIGTYVLTAVTGTTISYALTHADIASAAAVGTVTRPLLKPTAYYTSRVIKVPGAGASGADLYARINNIATGTNGAATRIVLVSGQAPSTTVAATTAIIGPGRYQTTTPGDSASFASPVACTDLAVALGLNSNGALLEVTIDGGLTVPNQCLTGQQLLDAGFVLSTDMVANGGTVNPAKYYLVCWATNPVFGVPRLTARNLASAVHTQLVTNIAAKPYNSTSGNLATIAGWGYGTSESPLTAGVELATLETPVRFFGNHEVALNVKPSGATTSDLCGGEGHGFENETSALQVILNGVVQTLTDGQCIAASEAILTRKSDLHHIEDQVSPLAKTRTVYRLDRRGLLVNQYIDFAKVISTNPGSYLVQYNVTPLFMAQLDAADATANMWTDIAQGNYFNTGHNTAAVWWRPGSRHICAVIVPHAKEGTDNWASTLQTTIRHMPEGAPAGGHHQHSKFYEQRQTLAAVGDRWTSEAVYVLGYLPDKAERYLPVLGATL